MSVIDNPRIKEKCQIFTPANIVSRMLDLAGYKDNIVGKTVLENSCGNGEFLVQIVDRYISSALYNNCTPDQIRTGLERDIVAYDIDQTLITIAKERLDAIALKYNIAGICWNIHNHSFLTANIQGEYDYILGNPPYIAYPDLPKAEQVALRKNFASCKKGKFDYCYAFIEKSYKTLSAGGKLVYIIPSNIFKNVFASELRTIIKPDVVAVVDYPQEDVFDNVLVSPAIISITKGANSIDFPYSIVSEKKEETHTISKDNLSEKWFFDIAHVGKKKLGDYFKVSNVIATLCNDVFVLKNGNISGNYYYIADERIEIDILRKATSPKSKRYRKEQNEYIIFPYYYNETGDLIRYQEDEITKRFPFALKYLKKHKDELAKRDADKSAKWYEFGRSQALQHINQEKVIISSVISEDTKAYLIGADEISYAGLFITPTGDIPLERIVEKLNSSRFRQYAACVGVSVSGSSKRVTAKDIENFTF